MYQPQEAARSSSEAAAGTSDRHRQFHAPQETRTQPAVEEAVRTLGEASAAGASEASEASAAVAASAEASADTSAADELVRR
eukprot:754827-Hanusia_phi.AAC.15